MAVVKKGSIETDQIGGIVKAVQEGMNTKNIMVMLYKMRLDASDIPNNNPLLAECIMVDYLNAEERKKLRELPVMNEMEALTKTAIEKLQAAPATKGTGGELNKEFETIKSNIHDLQLSKETKAQHWLRAIKDHQTSVEEIVKSIQAKSKEGKDLKSISKDPELRQSLSSISVALKATGVEIAALAAAMIAEKRKLDRLYSQAYSVVPPGDKAGLQPPRPT